MSQSLNHLNPHYYVHTATSAIQSPDIYQWGTTRTNLFTGYHLQSHHHSLESDDLLASIVDNDRSPLTLPLNVIAFCSDSLGTEHEIINRLWIYVREVVWHDGASDRDEELLRNKSLRSEGP